MKTPYQMHHGIDDATVPVAYVMHLDTVLTAFRVPHQLILYQHKGHLDVRSDSAVLDRIHRWYAEHGLFRPSEKQR
jgi:predicted esterase